MFYNYRVELVELSEIRSTKYENWRVYCMKFFLTLFKKQFVGRQYSPFRFYQTAKTYPNAFLFIECWMGGGVLFYFEKTHQFILIRIS